MATPTSTTTTRKPGLLLVLPRLHSPTRSNAATFLRWTKLHFRDLLSIPPSDPSFSVVGGRMTKTLRFAGGGDDDDDGDGMKYLYTLVFDDVEVLKSKGYYDVSRRLNLEGTRDLGAGEEGVGYAGENGVDAMVFDVVDARFAVFEEVEGSGGELGGDRKIGSFQDLPLSYTSTAGTKPSAPPSVLFSLHIRTSSPAASTDTPRRLQTSLLEQLASTAPAGLELFTSLYQWAGTKAQPENHPMIEPEEGGEWMVTLLIVEKEKGVLSREHVSGLVGKWVDGVNGEGDCKVRPGVWNGELFMS